MYLIFELVSNCCHVGTYDNSLTWSSSVLCNFFSSQIFLKNPELFTFNVYRIEKEKITMWFLGPRGWKGNRKKLKNTEKQPEGGRRATRTEGIYPKTMLAEGMKIWGCPYSRWFLNRKDKIKNSFWYLNALIERRMFCFRFWQKLG